VVITEGVVLDGRYRLDELIGRGGTAEVFRGTDELLGRAVAVKVFDSKLTDLNSVERQQTEMTVLASLNHPHLVAVHDAHIAASAHATDVSGHTYLVMELVLGATLADRLRDGPLPVAETVRIGVALADALVFIHARALVHRDIKPGNVLLGGAGEVKLGDFGLARLLTAEQRVTTSADVMGTAAYFSPEQASGVEVGSASDIYSLGLVLLECLTGVKEFPGEPVQSAVARLLRDPVVPAQLPAPWPELLTAMTDPLPVRRPSPADVAAVLADARTGFPPDEAVGSTVALGSVDDVRPAGFDQSTAGSGPMSMLFSAGSASSPSSRRSGLWVGALAAAAATTLALVAIMGSSTGADAPATTRPSPAASPTLASAGAAALDPQAGSTPASVPSRTAVAYPSATPQVTAPPVTVRTTVRQVAGITVVQPVPGTTPPSGRTKPNPAKPSAPIAAPPPPPNKGNGPGNANNGGKPKKPKKPKG
jgi:serine/threonine protein kinase